MLKPETGAVIPLLLALKVDYGILQDILSLSPLVTMRKMHGKLAAPAKPAYRGNLRSSQRDSLISMSDVLNEVLGKDAVLFQVQPKQQRGN